MSGEGSFGLNTAEKFFGLLILAIGIIALYYTWTSSSTLQLFTVLFEIMSATLMGIGLVLLLVKPE